MSFKVSVALFAAMAAFVPSIRAQQPHGTRNQVANINQMPYADAYPDAAGLFQPYGNDLQQIQSAIRDCPPSGCTVIVPAYMTGNAGDWTTGVDCTVNPLIQDFRQGTITYGHKAGAGTACAIIPTTGGGTVTQANPTTATALGGLLSYSFSSPTTTPTLSLTQPANTPAHSFFGVTGGLAGTAAFAQPAFGDLSGTLGPCPANQWVTTVSGGGLTCSTPTWPAGVSGAPFGLNRIFWITTGGCLPASTTGCTATSYTPASGARAAYVECVAGGGGGGAGLPTSANASAAGGGSAGQYVAVWIPSLAASYTVSIGAGGTGGVSGSTAGGTGGDTTFGAVLIAKGGPGGNGGTTAGTSAAMSIGGQNPPAGAVGDVTIVGGYGGYGVVYSGTLAQAGNGGASFFGAGNASPVYAAGSGSAGGRGAGTYGGGGAGGMNVGTNASYNNGAGAASGACRVSEYF